MNTRMITAALLTGTLLLCACANPRYVQLDNDRGRSYEIARFNMIIDPEAGLSAMPMEGIDGQAGEKTYKKYQAGFTEKAPETKIFNLNLGPGGS
ncbi:MAG: hypothetical protein RQ739_16250 [Desulfotignum sp.]|nr:hypothetical protein [Desulfotignum sp.]